MAQQTINIGAAPNDGTGDPLRDAFDKANDNFTELYTDKAPLASPALTGTPTAPTAAPGTNTTQIASAAFVTAAVASVGGGYTPGGTDVALADGGTGASLADPNADRILFWDDSAGAMTWLQAGSGLSISGTTITATGSGGDLLAANNLSDLASAATARTNLGVAPNYWELLVAVSDETTALTTGTGKVTFRMPRAVTLTEVRASVNTAPTGSTLIVDINEGGASILSTKLSIDASEKTSTTAASAVVISDASLADDAEITIDIDQVGSTVAGAGLKVLLKGTI